LVAAALALLVGVSDAGSIVFSKSIRPVVR
jgi:hypothetical protein